jgi:hypothetical protein
VAIVVGLVVLASMLIGFLIDRREPSWSSDPASLTGRTNALVLGGYRPAEGTFTNDDTARERAAQAVRATAKTSPDELSTNAALAPFDRETFEKDPATYLARVVPARCFQTAKPGADVHPLEVKSPVHAAVPSGGDAPLWVKAEPGAPVTFTAFDGGEFKENGLPSVTVRADGRGLAMAHFIATRGVVGDVTIVVGSPLNSGVQRFVLRASP